MKKISLVLAAMMCALIMISCATTKAEEVTPETSSGKIIQLAQTALDEGKPNQALKYYNLLLQYYGMNDNAIYVEARYEIAHIYVKQKKYDLAKPMLEEVISIYDSCPVGTLPGAYKKLAQLDLAKINKN